MLLKTRMFLVWWLHIKIFVDSPLISDDEELQVDARLENYTKWFPKIFPLPKFECELV